MTEKTKVRALFEELVGSDATLNVEGLIERVVERCAATVEAQKASYEAREAHDGGPPLGRMVEEIAASIREVIR